MQLITCSLHGFGIVGCKSTAPDLFCRILAPWNNHAAANPAKNRLGGVDFRY